MEKTECPFCKGWASKRQTCPVCNPLTDRLKEGLARLQEKDLKQEEFDSIIKDIDKELEKFFNLDFQQERKELERMSKPELIERVLELLKERVYS